MPQSIINEPTLALDRYDGNIFVITMRKAPENRVNVAYAQKLISAFNKVRQILGTDSEGAVITKGNDAKFWCTVSHQYHLLRSCRERQAHIDASRASNWKRQTRTRLQTQKASSHFWQPSSTSPSQQSPSSQAILSAVPARSRLATTTE